jgi:hypothetical protein
LLSNEHQTKEYDMTKKKLCLLVCGHGALANAIMHSKEDRTVRTVRFDPNFNINELPTSVRRRIVAVHAGSGKEFLRLLAYCEDRGIPIIQASTGQKVSHRPKVVVVEGLNLGLTMIAFLKAMPILLKIMTRDPAVRIVSKSIKESHQAEKNTPPGTAYALAKILQKPIGSIISIRDLNGQLEMGVSTHSLGRHAYHLITLGFMDGMNLEIKPKVHGLGSYAFGAHVIAYRMLAAIKKGELKPGNHSVTALLKM